MFMDKKQMWRGSSASVVKKNRGNEEKRGEISASGDTCLFHHCIPPPAASPPPPPFAFNAAAKFNDPFPSPHPLSQVLSCSMCRKTCITQEILLVTLIVPLFFSSDEVK